MPDGVSPDEWLDLWRNNKKNTNEPDREWNIVDMETADTCCPNGWYEENPPPAPSNKIKYEQALKDKDKIDSLRADKRKEEKKNSSKRIRK